MADVGRIFKFLAPWPENVCKTHRINCYNLKLLQFEVFRMKKMSILSGRFFLVKYNS